MSLGALSKLTAAAFTTGNGTYALTVGWQLALLINGDPVADTATQDPVYGGNLVTFTVETGMFPTLGAVTATQLAAALNTAFQKQAAAGQQAAAVAVVSGSAVKVSSVRLGVNATIQVLFTSTAGFLSALTLTSGTVYSGAGYEKVGGGATSVFVDVINFTGDTSYPTGGTLGFTALLQALTLDGRQPLAVIGQDCAGYSVAYLPGTDALKVFESGDENASPTAMAEVVNATNLSSTTFNVVVISV